MARLNQQFPRFSDKYEGALMRAFMRQLENALSLVQTFTGAAYKEISADYTVLAVDSLLYVDTTGGNVIITLPLVSQNNVNDRFEIIIKKKVAANTITINKTGTDTVDGGSSLTLTSVSTFHRLRAINGGWITI
jgi:hypothetical protein